MPIQTLTAHCTYDETRGTIVSISGLDRVPSSLKSRAVDATNQALKLNPVPTQVKVPNVNIVVDLEKYIPAMPTTLLDKATCDNTPYYSLAGHSYTAKVLWSLENNPCYFDVAIVFHGAPVRFKLWDQNARQLNLIAGDFVRIDITGFATDCGDGVMHCNVTRNVT